MIGGLDETDLTLAIRTKLKLVKFTLGPATRNLTLSQVSVPFSSRNDRHDEGPNRARSMS